MIINDLDVERVTLDKMKANSPLVVDPNAPLTLSVTFQCFQLIRWWKFQIPDLCCGVELRQTHRSAFSDIGRNPLRSARRVKSLSLGVGERPYHLTSINILFMQCQYLFHIAKAQTQRL